MVQAVRTFGKTDGFSLAEVAISLVILGFISMGLFSISKFVFKGTQKVHSSNLMSTAESQLMAALASPAFYESLAPVEGSRVRDRLDDGTLTAIVVNFDGQTIADTRKRIYQNILSGSVCTNPTTDPACAVYIDLGLQKTGTAWKIAYRIGALPREGLPVAPLGAAGVGPAFAANDFTFLIPEAFYKDLGELVCGAGQILDGYEIVGTTRVARCLKSPNMMSCPVGQYPVGFTKVALPTPVSNIGGSSVVGNLNIDCKVLPRLECPAGFGIQKINARKLVAQDIGGITCAPLTVGDVPINGAAEKIVCPAGYEFNAAASKCTIQKPKADAVLVDALPMCAVGKSWFVDASDPANGHCCDPKLYKSVEKGVCKL